MEYRSLDCRTLQGDYFYLYRISYMWYCPLGFLIAVVVGWATSWAARWIFKQDSTEIDPALLSPIVADRVRKKRRETDKFGSTLDTSSRERVLNATL